MLELPDEKRAASRDLWEKREIRVMYSIVTILAGAKVRKCPILRSSSLGFSFCMYYSSMNMSDLWRSSFTIGFFRHQVYDSAVELLEALVLKDKNNLVPILSGLGRLYLQVCCHSLYFDSSTLRFKEAITHFFH